MMTFRSGVKLLTCGLVCGSICFALGCKETPEQRAQHASEQEKKEMLAHNDEFLPNDDNRSWKQFANQQVAAGAQDDASLSAEHFTGGKLNALGREKLGMVMHGPQPAVVYLGSNDDATNNLRRSAIDEYLKESGAASDALVVKSGFNPRTGTLGVANIARAPRADSQGKDVSLTPGGSGPSMYGPGVTSQSGGGGGVSGGGTATGGSQP
jgi:hypothetical protein